MIGWRRKTGMVQMGFQQSNDIVSAGILENDGDLHGARLSHRGPTSR
jgi:hypothetical protein